jgi:hypothetical protein
MFWGLERIRSDHFNVYCACNNVWKWAKNNVIDVVNSWTGCGFADRKNELIFSGRIIGIQNVLLWTFIIQMSFCCDK